MHTAATTTTTRSPRHASTYSDLARHWPKLDRDTCFLNHGSFGAAPAPVLEHQRKLREQLEHEPVRFMMETLEPLWLDAVNRCAEFLGCDPEGFAFVTNATTGVNTVLNSLNLRPGDELLTTDHEYNACANALRHAAQRHGAEVVTAELPFPVESPQQVTDAVLARVTPNTKLALIDHVTSPTGTVLPIADIVRALDDKGVDTLVDGAHAPGMLDLSVRAINPAYYTGNWHKWVCAPKGAGFLWCREDRRERIRPLVISHGANANRDDRSLFQTEFAWQGTGDPTPFLSVPKAIDTMGALLPGGWPEVRARNTALVTEGRRRLIDRLGLEPACPESMLGSLATLILPAARAGGADASSTTCGIVVGYPSEVQRRLVREFGIQVPVMFWGDGSRRLVRISAQLYNATAGYEALAGALETLLPEC